MVSLSTFSVIFFILVFLILGTFAYAGLSAAPWVPLWKKDVRRMLTLAKVKPGEMVYDLGAGDGRIIIMASQEFGAQSVGFEMSILPYCLAYIKILLSGLRGKTSLQYRNFFDQNFGQADVICTFLSPKAMEKLKPKFEAEAKPGCRIVSFAFHVPGWQARIIDQPNSKTTSVYLYQRWNKKTLVKNTKSLKQKISKIKC